MMPDKTILLVDDDVDLLDSLGDALELKGYQVVRASSGEEAAKMSSLKKFDLVLTDLIMGAMGGIELLKLIKADHPDTAVLLHTGHGNLSSAIDALRNHADDYVLKSSSPAELHFRVDKALERIELAKKIRLYEKILPICSECRQIRDDEGKEPGRGSWMPLEKYLKNKTGVDVSHGLCDCCYEKRLEDIC